eukprot:gb/GECG01004511.1/.p1 GENE.gb/GECG01004511.1/~~gb/GECG01004511.1/.p1  ORF type:complete len:779 (+),score=168.64 gb/GECG01004511.1/:1-2337(+)
MPSKRKQKRAQRKAAEESEAENNANTERDVGTAEEGSEDTAMVSPPQTRQQQSSVKKSASAGSSSRKATHEEEHHSSSVRRTSTTTTTRRGHSLGPNSSSSGAWARHTPGTERSETTEQRRSSVGSLRGKTPTPHKPSRAKEQQDLQHLNTRLENYVSFHKALRDERDRLAEQVNTTIEEYNEKFSRFTEEHEEQVQELTKSLEEARRESREEQNRAERAEADLEKLRQETHDYAQIKRDRNQYRERARELEEEVKHLKNRLASAEDNAEQLRDQLEQALSEKTEVNNELQREKSRRESLETERNDLKQRYDTELADAQARAKTQLQKAREDWEKYLNEKLEQLEVDLRQQYEDEIGQLHDRVESAREESERLRSEWNEMRDTEQKHQQYVNVLQGKLKKAEEQLLSAEDEYHQSLKRLQAQVAAEREAKEATQDEFNELMDVKINLDAEIDHYRRILEDEENYYNLQSPNSRPLLGGNTEYVPDRTGRAAAAREEIERAAEEVSNAPAPRSASDRISHIESTEQFSSSSLEMSSSSTRKRTRATASHSEAARKSRKQSTRDEASEQGDVADDEEDAGADDVDTAASPSRPTTRRQTRQSSSKKRAGYARRSRTHDTHIPQTRSRSSSVDSVEMTEEGLEPADEQLRQGTGFSVDLVEEKVSVENRLEEPLNMDGWSLRSDIGEQTFRFPDNFVLQPGETVTVWSGPGAASMEDPPRHLYWTSRYIWNNQGDKAVLLDDEGREVSMVDGVPVQPGAPGTPARIREGQAQNQNQNCVIM